MVYFDQNVYDHCCDNLSVAELKSILKSKKYSLVLGPLNLIELASCFKNDKPEKIERGKELFRFLQELLPIGMLWPIEGLMRREMLIAAGRGDIGICLTGGNKRRFEEEIRKLAKGDFHVTARKHILKDWEERISGKKVFEASCRKPGGLTKEAVAKFSFSEYVRQPETAYEEYRKQWTSREVEIICPSWPRKMLNFVAKRISTRPAKFVAFSIAAKITLFLNFKVAKDATFSHDMPMDLKHLSNAIHIGTFVTGDSKFRAVAKDITPGKGVFDIQEYFGE